MKEVKRITKGMRECADFQESKSCYDLHNLGTDALRGWADLIDLAVDTRLTTEYAVACRNPISGRWIYGEPKHEYLAAREFAEMKARGTACRLIKRQVTSWEVIKEIKESEAKQ